MARKRISLSEIKYQTPLDKYAYQCPVRTSRVGRGRRGIRYRLTIPQSIAQILGLRRNDLIDVTIQVRRRVM